MMKLRTCRDIERQEWTNKRRFALVPLVFIMALTCIACTARSPAGSQPADAGKPKTELLVAAAASLKDSLDVIGEHFEESHKDIDIIFHYGSSGTLQKQIEQGAPADLFLSAGEKQMEALVGKGLIASHTVLLQNDLVVVVPADADRNMAALDELAEDDIGKIAIGQPETVPAGQYAKEALTAFNLWDALQHKLVFAKDVRQALTYVESGNVDAGFVYRTDALVSEKVRIAYQVDSGVHAPIVYPVGIVKESAHAEEAALFYHYLQSEEARAVFKPFGFTLP